MNECYYDKAIYSVNDMCFKLAQNYILSTIYMPREIHNNCKKVLNEDEANAIKEILGI